MMKVGASLLLLGTAAASYVGTFSLVPEDQCGGACICVGNQDEIAGQDQEKNELNMEFYEHKLRAITALCVINLVIGVILIVLFGLAVKRISDFFDKMTQESFQAILIQEHIDKKEEEQDNADSNADENQPITSSN